MAKGGQQVTKSEVTQSNLPEYARPYFEGMLNRANTLTTQPFQRYVNAQGQPIGRIAGFTDQQTQLQNAIMGQQTPGEFGQAGGFLSQAGLGSLGAADYDTGQFSNQQIGLPNLQQFSMRGPADVTTQQYMSPEMRAAQSSYGSQPLEQFRMNAPEQFGGVQAQQYMSPYIQNVLEIQKREALNDAKRGQLAQNLGASRQGAYGGSRQLMATMERERNLGQQMGDIQARGLQSAYENAQQQFERDRAAGFNVGQQNLEAALRQQQLGVSTGLQVAMANLSNEQQANVQNLAAQLQTQGLNADQALRAALANQQTGLQVGQQNLQAALQTQQLGTQSGLEALRANQQADLERQRMREQSRQFGAQNRLNAYNQLGQLGQTMTNLGSARSQADLARYGLQTQTAAQRQALDQQKLDMAYQDFLRERDYPLEMLQQYSSLLRGVPVEVGSTKTTYAQQPGIAQQLLGTGLSAASIYNTFSGGR